MWVILVFYLTSMRNPLFVRCVCIQRAFLSISLIVREERCSAKLLWAVQPLPSRSVGLSASVLPQQAGRVSEKRSTCWNTHRILQCKLQSSTQQTTDYYIVICSSTFFFKHNIKNFHYIISITIHGLLAKSGKYVPARSNWFFEMDFLRSL